jgi:hypothetical protein
MKKAPPDPKKAAARAALRALKKAERTAAREGVELSEWEGEFLENVAERVKTYGRAFADPDKGAPGTVLSLRQGLKLKEIAKKAKGETKTPRKDPGEAEGDDRREDKVKTAAPRRGFRRRPRKGDQR